MQIETCRVGRTLRLDEDTRIVIHRRQGARVVLGATAPVGTPLTLDGARLRPISGTVGLWTWLFSLQALRRFSLGPFEVHLWLPGEWVALAADCEDWLHIGVRRWGASEASPAADREVVSLPTPVALARPPAPFPGDGRRPLRAGA